MAKWGEGDPRWIVEERPDAINVNNWHWTEKNAGKWSKDKFNELLKDFKFQSDTADVSITEIDTMDGDATATNRKGKLFFFYDWNIVLTWKGRLLGGSGEECQGKIEIPNLGEEYTLEEIDIIVTLKDSTSEGEIIKEFLHFCGNEQIREQLGIYLNKLKEEFSKGMILPKKNEEMETKDKCINNLSEGFNKNVSINENSKKTKEINISVNSVTSYKTKEKFYCTAEEFYQALTVPMLVEAFTAASVVLEPVVGGKFALFNGSVSGTFVELIPNKKLVQKWRLSSWPQDYYSTVIIEIEQESSHTSVSITQNEIPSDEIEMIKGNWNRYYWESLKRIFGWGFFL